MPKNMPDPTPTHPPHLALPVLQSNDKVEQLRQSLAADPPTAARTFADRTPVDRLLDPSTSPAQKAILERVIDALRTVYDPEIPVNLYDLGLIYDIDVADEGAVRVRMTLTAPGCPVAGTLPLEVQKKVESVEGVRDAAVELVWDPPWTKDRMSEAALLELGLL
jgi:FeS assembly SUF system protein